MNRRPTERTWARVTGIASILAMASIASAVPYASGVRNTASSMWEFILNEPADSVTINRDGGSPVTFTAPAAGRYTFDMTGFSAFDIDVSKTAPAGLTRISDPTNLYTKFFRPNGLAVNTDPTSQYFGTVYVANGIAASTGGANVRATGDGIYSLTADQKGVDLSTSTWVVPDAQDTAQAKVGAGWDVAGSNSVFRISLDDGGNVIVGDWSDDNGGIKYIAPNLTGGGLVLALQEGPTYGAIDPGAPLDGSVSPFVHGSIRGVPNARGTVGVDLVVSAIDEDLNRDPIGLVTGVYPPDALPGDANHLWQWNVGAQTDSVVKPKLLIDVGNNASLGQLGSDSSGRPYQLSLNIGVRADAEFFPQIGANGLWILTTPRSNGDESGIVIVDVDETGANPPNVLWSSRQFTIDAGIDGFPNDPDDLGQDPNSDLFRNTGSVEVSADGQFLYVHRWFVDAPGAAAPNVNPYLGTDSNLPGKVLKIPLDANGLPVIEFNDNGTPGDKTDDIISNFESIETGNNTGQANQHDIEVDAAGNIYIVDNGSELLEVFSPGGESLTRYSFDGTNFSFQVVGPTLGLPGDYNGDGMVDAADYTVWRDGDSPDSGPSGYALWASNYGATSLANGSSAAIPEPASVLIALGMFGFTLAGRARRS